MTLTATDRGRLSSVHLHDRDAPAHGALSGVEPTADLRSGPELQRPGQLHVHGHRRHRPHQQRRDSQPVGDSGERRSCRGGRGLQDAHQHDPQRAARGERCRGRPADLCGHAAADEGHRVGGSGDGCVHLPAVPREDRGGFVQVQGKRRQGELEHRQGSRSKSGSWYDTSDTGSAPVSLVSSPEWLHRSYTVVMGPWSDPQPDLGFILRGGPPTYPY